MTPKMELRREWIRFTDANGDGWAEPDGFLLLDHEVVVFEIKLTGCRYAVQQLRDLYAPLLLRLFERPVRGLQICRALGPATPGPFVEDVDEFLTSALPLATWHWPGR